MSIADAVSYIEADETQLLADMQALLAVDTSLPPGGGYRELNARVKEQVLPLGFACEEVLVPEELWRSEALGFAGPRANMIASRRRGRPRLSIYFHTDTVPRGPGWTEPPFAATCRGDRVYGRGAADMKGTIAATVYALRATETCNVAMRYDPILLCCTVACAWMVAHMMAPSVGRAVQIIFQHPDLSLNPRYRIREIIRRPLLLHGQTSRREADRMVRALLEQVRLPTDYAERYPHQLSGGEKQRVTIARAFGLRPRVVICDEITSGLNASVQASIVNLLADLQDEYGTAYLFITHDLNLVQHIADRVAIMYLGRIAELRATSDIYRPPYHPYAEALLSAVPTPDPSVSTRRILLEGPMPSSKNPPPGCRFSSRCPRNLGEICDREPPPLRQFGHGHWLTCHIPEAELRSLSDIWVRAASAASVEVNAAAGANEMT